MDNMLLGSGRFWRTGDIRLTENAIRTTFRLDGAIAADTHSSKFVSAA
jgi:hypothetical protein